MKHDEVDLDSPPPCARKGCDNRVRWNDRTGTWCVYCSRSCSGMARAMRQPLQSINRAREHRVIEDLLRSVLGPDYRDGDPISMEQVHQLLTAARARRARHVAQGASRQIGRHDRK